MESSSNRIEVDKFSVDSVERIKDKIKHTVTVNTEYNKTVVVLGNTGVGKSTLIHYLSNNNLTVVKNRFKFTFEAKTTLDKITIGQSSNSQTSAPNKWIDAQNTIFLDCPGFNDTYGAEQDLINSIFIQKIF